MLIHICSAMRRLITENVEVVYGPNVLTQRQQTEVAYLNATEQILVPAGVCNRWTNYTAHPSQTPGSTPAQGARSIPAVTV